MLSRLLSIVFAFTTTVFGLILVRNQNTQAPQSAEAATQQPSHPTPLILQERDGERRLRRPGGPTGSGSVPEFFIKVDKQNGGAEDFYVGYEILKPGAMIPFHKHHNSEDFLENVE